MINLRPTLSIFCPNCHQEMRFAIQSGMNQVNTKCANCHGWVQASLNYAEPAIVNKADNLEQARKVGNPLYQNKNFSSGKVDHKWRPD